MPTILLYKVVLLILLAGASGSTASIAYYYQGRTNDLTHQVTNLNVQNNSQNGQIDSLKSQIDNLTRQIANLSQQITLLQSANLQLANLIAQLREQIGTGALCSSGKTLTVGELLDLSSSLSTFGLRAQESSALALNDVNSFLSSAGCNLKFAVAVNDYALDNNRALTELQSLQASGVQVVVGPLNSGAAQFILSYANSNHIVLISPSSTSPALAIPNDYLFRTSPNDAAQALADARMLVDRGASAIIIVQRHDTYGDGLASAITARFTALGGNVANTIQYDAAASDFTPVLNQLYNDYQSANTTYPNKVAIYAVSFEEIGQMLIQANQQHPSLLNGKLPWFGTDGEAQDSVIVNNATSGPIVAKVKLPSTLYSVVNNTKTLAFYSRFASAYPGSTCDAYCLGAYDDLWLAALATLQVGSYDGTKIQAVMLTVASNYYGVTGSTDLEASGDRSPQSYQIWVVVNEGSPGIPTWVLAGTWDAFSDSVTWLHPP